MTMRSSLKALSAALLTSCIPMAVHPFHSEDTLTFEPLLLGVWEEEDDDEDARWSFFAHNPHSYIFEHEVPYNPLHDRGYPSIGCTNCTRAVRPGEDPRAGRWSDSDKLECGLHTVR